MAIPGNSVMTMDPLTERLATMAPQQRTHLAGDGVQPGNAPVAPDQPPEEQAPPAKTLKDASPQDQFRTVNQLCESQNRLRRNRYAIDTYHGWLDDNVPFTKLEKMPNQNVWKAALAPGVTAERAGAVPNKAADLCNKIVDALLADPPKPNPQPHVEDESVDAAADLASEFLRQNAGESGINEVQQYRWALRNALTRSTSWLEFDVDRDGGGYQPYQVLAHPQAQDPNNPMVATMPGPVDPMTGQSGPPIPLPAVDPILRYVSDSQQFVDDASQAGKVWTPALVVRRHPRVKVITIPATAAIEDAEVLILTDYRTLAQARHEWPDTVGTMTMEQLQKLAQWTPSFMDLLLPFTFKGNGDGATGPDMDTVGSLSPLLQKRMWFHRCVIRASQEYPEGFQLDISGANNGTVLSAISMDYEVPMPQGGSEVRCRDIPWVQVTPNQDVAGHDPMGWPFEARFDGSCRADSEQLSQYLDALERMANPHVFIRSNASIDEDEWDDRSKPIVIGPSDQVPFYEQFSPLPPAVQFSEYIERRNDVASGLTATAQGLETATSESGIAKKLTVRQAQISLAGIQQQLHSAMTRGWRVMCQWVQAEFKTPQLIRYSGEESSSQEQWWTGQDFAGIDTIGIEPGTGTFMTAEDKANYIAFLQGQGWLTPEAAGEIGVTGIARDLGLPTDPVDAAIERSVGVWLKGPPDGWVDLWKAYQVQKQQYDQAMAQFQQAQQAFQQYTQLAATAQSGPPSGTLGPEAQTEKAGIDYQAAGISLHAMLMQNPNAATPPVAPQLQPPQKPWTPFEDRPSDTEPEVAKKYTKRLHNLQFSPRYMAQDPAWRQAADEKYNASRQAYATATGAAPQNPHAGNPSQQQPAKNPSNAPGFQPPNSTPQAA